MKVILESIVIIFISWQSAYPVNLELISKDLDGNAVGPCNHCSFCSTCKYLMFKIDMSDDGRYIVFASTSNNIVEGDTNNTSINYDINGPSSDIFLYDRLMNRMERVSLRANGGQIETGFSWEPSISADGKYIAYISTAHDIFPNDTRHLYGEDDDVFLFDVENRRIKWVSVSPEGIEGDLDSYRAQISKNGNYIIFLSFANNIVDNLEPFEFIDNVFLYDIKNNSTKLVSVGNDETHSANFWTNGFVYPTVSDNGRYAAFVSSATNMTSQVQGGVFLRDMESEMTYLISLLPDGSPGPSRGYSSLSISRDGRYVAFSSSAHFLPYDPHPDSDGFIYDRLTGMTSIIPLGSYDYVGRPYGAKYSTISATGIFLVFTSESEVRRMYSNNEMIWSINELYKYDHQIGDTRLLISVAGYSGLVDSDSYHYPASFGPYLQITPDGKKILFTTDAQLVPEDTNTLPDVYLLELDDEPSAVPGWELNR